MAHPARLSTGRPLFLALVRHAETTWVVEDRFQGRADTPLSEAGREQARRVAARLADPAAPPPLPLPAAPPVAIWHSPLRRAADTAAAIAAAQRRPAPLATVDDLVELSVGDWEGLTNAEVAERWPAELEAWRRDPTTGLIPGGEPAGLSVPRVREAVDTIVAELAASVGAAPGTPAWGVVVSHDGILRVALLELLRLPLDRYWAFPLFPVAITVLERVTDGRWRLRGFGL